MGVSGSKLETPVKEAAYYFMDGLVWNKSCG